MEDTPFKDIFDTYNGTIKDLLADIESRYQQFPLPIYNEIRAVFDHISQCYESNIDTDDVQRNVIQAEGHIKRIVFDCYKYLYVHQNSNFEEFERRTKNVDIRSIDDRKFYDEYTRLRKGARDCIKKAKKIESRDPHHAFILFKEAFKIASQAEDLIDKYSNQIWQARAKHFLSIIGRIILFILTAILAGLISDLIGFFRIIENIFNK